MLWIWQINLVLCMPGQQGNIALRSRFSPSFFMLHYLMPLSFGKRAESRGNSQWIDAKQSSSGFKWQKHYFYILEQGHLDYGENNHSHSLLPWKALNYAVKGLFLWAGRMLSFVLLAKPVDTLKGGNANLLRSQILC